MWKIGNVEIDNQVVLAPMAGISNSAYRRIIKEMGCGLIYAEMVSDKAISFGNKKTLDMLYMTDSERPIAQQIFGTDVESFVVAAKYIEKTMKPDIIDINMGCPVPKVALRAQAGSALLKNPQKIREIVSAVVAAVNVPVTVKIRSGWDSDHINAVEVAKICEEAGASAITVHPRTRKQGYSGKADWLIIKNVKDNVSIPVIGNGDIIDEESALRMFEYTGVDGIMIGRGAIGNPWIFEQIKYYLENNKKMSAPTNKEKYEIIKEHLELNLKEKGNVVGINEMRKHISAYTKNMPEASRFRDEINHITDVNILMSKIQEFFIDIFDKK